MTTQEFLNLLDEALGLPAGSVGLDGTPETVDAWDSVGQLSILATIEQQVGVATNAPDLVNATSVADLATALRARGVLED